MAKVLLRGKMDADHLRRVRSCGCQLRSLYRIIFDVGEV
jgi:hypothetical protein